MAGGPGHFLLYESIRDFKNSKILPTPCCCCFFNLLLIKVATGGDLICLLNVESCQYITLIGILYCVPLKLGGWNFLRSDWEKY